MRRRRGGGKYREESRNGVEEGDVEEHTVM